MNILIADDHQLIIDDLTDELSTIIPEAECVGTTDPDTIPGLFETYRFDVVFLDIEIRNVSGISIAKKILAKYPRTNIIYITGYEKYALESYETAASSFLVKPVSTEKIKKAMENLRFPVSEITDDMIEAQYSGSAVIGKKIQKFREEANMTRNELATKMSVSLQTVYRWENGERVPDMVTFMKLARVLGFNMDKLM